MTNRWVFTSIVVVVVVCNFFFLGSFFFILFLLFNRSDRFIVDVRIVAFQNHADTYIDTPVSSAHCTTLHSKRSIDCSIRFDEWTTDRSTDRPNEDKVQEKWTANEKQLNANVFFSCSAQQTIIFSFQNEGCHWIFHVSNVDVMRQSMTIIR